jgi:CheY-like chemotaxis protein
MEAVGRLAGGVAHDFNNLLTVIRGYAELLAPSLDSDPNGREEIAEILRAAERAATLTGQLLAFSRRQTLEMHPLDLRAAVADTEKMLRRLIGEDIRLEVALPPALGRVNADRGQIEQVLLNLAVNARDAMPDGGPLRIALFETVVEKPLAAADGPIPPGRYVVLAVADKGTGMDSETRAHAFEPFYTTKEKGKGTGLGLSTVFGIVKQSGGHIRLTSAPGAGATFELYFPRAGDEDGEEAPVRAGERGGTETILIAEDEAGVRDLAARFLARWGYRILTAESGPAALARAGTETRPIDLLLTDLVMPGMSGAALARSLAAKRPGLKILFMSGYPHDVLAESPSPPPPLLRKPFTEADLVRQVREALDGPPSVFASPPGDPGRDDAPG